MSQRGQYYNNYDNRNKRSNRRGRRSQNYNEYQGQHAYGGYQDQNQGQQAYEYQDQNQGQYQNYNADSYQYHDHQARNTHNNNYKSYPRQQQQQQQQQPQKRHSHHAPKKHDPNVMMIDGSMMEGGGQILRNSTALCALLHKPVSVHSIRGKRNNPGLRKQHLKGIELIQQINGGKLTGNYMKSTEITYYPSAKQSYDNNYSIDIETAGSVCLLIQTCFPLFIYSPFQCKLSISGGTNASFAPQIDYFILVLQPMLKRLMNINVDCKVIQRGFYPKGGGKVVVITEPLKNCIPAFDLTKRGKIKRIYGRVVIAGRDLTSAVGNVMIRGAVRELKIMFGKTVDIKIDIVPKCINPSLSSGIAMTIVAETDTGCLFGGSSLGDYGALRSKRGLVGGSYSNKPYAYRVDDNDVNPYYEEVGRIAARELIADWKSSKTGCTDRWLQDQLIIFMALAKGKSRMKTCTLEMHAKTAIYIAEMMTGVKFNVAQQKDGSVLVECDGIAYDPQHETNKQNDDHKDNRRTNEKQTKSNDSSYLSNRPSFI